MKKESLRLRFWLLVMDLAHWTGRRGFILWSVGKAGAAVDWSGYGSGEHGDRPERHPMSARTLGGADVLARALVATRAADAAFQKAGGTSRHWLRDWFIPHLAEQGLAIYGLEEGEKIAKERADLESEKARLIAERDALRAECATLREFAQSIADQSCSWDDMDAADEDRVPLAGPCPRDAGEPPCDAHRAYAALAAEKARKP